jgi:hypothetical protein
MSNFNPMVPTAAASVYEEDWLDALRRGELPYSNEGYEQLFQSMDAERSMMLENDGTYKNAHRADEEYYSNIRRLAKYLDLTDELDKVLYPYGTYMIPDIIECMLQTRDDISDSDVFGNIAVVLLMRIIGHVHKDVIFPVMIDLLKYSGQENVLGIKLSSFFVCGDCYYDILSRWNHKNDDRNEMLLIALNLIHWTSDEIPSETISSLKDMFIMVNKNRNKNTHYYDERDITCLFQAYVTNNARKDSFIGHMLDVINPRTTVYPNGNIPNALFINGLEYADNHKIQQWAQRNAWRTDN